MVFAFLADSATLYITPRYPLSAPELGFHARVVLGAIEGLLAK